MTNASAGPCFYCGGRGFIPAKDGGLDICTGCNAVSIELPDWSDEAKKSWEQQTGQPADQMPTPPPPSQHREPIEADREAYKEMMGGWTDETGPQFFMRHRLAFSTPAASDAAQMREACAKVAESAIFHSDYPYDEGSCNRIATRIRALSLPKAGEGEADRAAVAELVEAIRDAAKVFEAMGEHAAAEDLRSLLSRHQAGLGKGDDRG